MVKRKNSDRLDDLKVRLAAGENIGESDLRYIASFPGTWDSLSRIQKETLAGSAKREGEPGVEALTKIAPQLANSDEFIFFTGGLKGGPRVIGSGSTLGAAEAAGSTGNIFSRHKFLTALGLGGAGLWGAGQFDFFGSDDEGGGGGSTPTTTRPPDEDLQAALQNGATVLGPDGQVLDIPVPSAGVQQSFGQQSFAPGSDIANLIAQQGLNPNAYGLSQIESVDSNYLGSETINPSVYPGGVDVYGKGIPDAETYIKKRSSTGLSDFAISQLPEEDAQAAAGYGIAAPPGAKLNPRFFSPVGEEETFIREIKRRGGGGGSHGGTRGGSDNRSKTITTTTPAQSLSSIAAAAAREYGVPIDILYGVINSTSGWDPKAVGNQGATYGLGQISEGRINRNAAQDPKVALRFVARTLAHNAERYGGWEMAALEYHSEGAAERLLKDGTIDSTNKSWLTDTLNSSAESGLGNNLFDFAGLAALSTSSGSGRGSGPQIPAFVEPDRATLRENARRAVENTYGRTTEGEELESFVEQLMAGYREAYEQDVVTMRGGAGYDVDPQARLSDQLTTSGEGQFRVERDQQRSMMDTVGDWARIVQGA